MEQVGRGACGPGRTWWFTTFLVLVAGSLCLIMTLARVSRPGRWWPWPMATVLIMVGWLVIR